MSYEGALWLTIGMACLGFFVGAMFFEMSRGYDVKPDQTNFRLRLGKVFLAFGFINSAPLVLKTWSVLIFG